MRISDEHNISQIEMLSQRGRTLSIVDLLNANTLSVEMAAHLFCIMSHGASFLTAAKPGNAGKTTLMACILMFLPPNTSIVTINEPSVISRALQGSNERACYLCHEIGSGPWYGYLWGDDVGRFFKLIDKSHSIASCIHADTIDEMKEIILSDELNVSEEYFRQLDFILFMHLERNGWETTPLPPFGKGEYTRRVSTFYEATGALSQNSESHRPLFIWDKDSDKFYQQDDSLLLQTLGRSKGIDQKQIQKQLVECEDFIRWLIEQKINDYRKVRKEIISFYEQTQK
ncbi:hypothetical protein H8E77_26505 [bacterium]|nr:hypothetical protein [bacterium]